MVMVVVVVVVVNVMVDEGSGGRCNMCSST